MIVVSQDKKAIHNFDNVLSLQIEPTLKEYSIKVYDVINDGSSLGVYSTEERAKEVLQEIINTFSLSEIKDTYERADLIIKLRDIALYQMPEK